MMKTVYADGTAVPTGICIQVDHYEQEFTLKISSMRHISAETLKDLIQQKFKVLEIQKCGELVVAR
jgi:hypothetical protein